MQSYWKKIQGPINGFKMPFKKIEVFFNIIILFYYEIYGAGLGPAIQAVLEWELRELAV